MLTEDRFTYIPNHIYAFYHLHYNNYTYGAIRKALEETSITSATSETDTEAIRTRIMNLVIDACLERCGAALYLGAENELMSALKPFDSYLTTLALRHLANFGAPPSPNPPTILPALFDDLRLTCAELHLSAHQARQERGYKARLAGEWLYASALLVGSAADLLTDTFSPGMTWRVGAQEKLSAAFGALRDGLEQALEDDYTLTPKTREAILQILMHFPLP